MLILMICDLVNIVCESPAGWGRVKYGSSCMGVDSVPLGVGIAMYGHS